MPEQKREPLIHIRQVSALAAARRGAAFPGTAGRSQTYHSATVSTSDGQYDVLLLRTGKRAYVAGQGGVAWSPQHQSPRADLACWAGDKCGRGGGHGWTQYNNEAVRPRRLAFEVRYPFGGSYCEQLRTSLEQLGFFTGEDRLLDGSDVGGFLVAHTAEALVDAIALVDAAIAGMERVPDPDLWWDYEVYERLWTMGVSTPQEDWGYWDWDELPWVGEFYAVRRLSKWVVEVRRTKD